MSEYIKLEPLREEVLNDIEYDGDTVNYFLGIVDSQPVADVVEVVRCKDCNGYNKHRKHCNYSGCLVFDDDFCSHGKRKEGAEE